MVPSHITGSPCQHHTHTSSPGSPESGKFLAFLSFSNERQFWGLLPLVGGRARERSWAVDVIACACALRKV